MRVTSRGLSKFGVRPPLIRVSGGLTLRDPLVGAFADAFPTYLYFSMETYTSLGLGDVVPQGIIRLLAGMEVLNGILLIGWSASFVVVAMQHIWELP